MSTPKKTDDTKKRPGRPTLPPNERKYPVGYVRLLADDVTRLDAVATAGRAAFIEDAVIKAIGKAERKNVRA